MEVVPRVRTEEVNTAPTIASVDELRTFDVLLTWRWSVSFPLGGSIWPLVHPVVVSAAA